MAETLKEYKAKRNFRKTKEPSGNRRVRKKKLQFVVQEHHASRLHYDFRLEWNGVLKSWAVPKGPSLDPSVKRLAVQVEDHPIEYGKFEGTIPKGEYGAGKVYIWDSGQWRPHGDPKKALQKGHLDFELEGRRLHGGWTLVRTQMKASGAKSNWLLIKKTDDEARRGRVAEIQPIQSPGKRVGRGSLFPLFVKPQLATLVDEPPEGPGWLHEVKFDGYRILAAVQNGEVRLWTRNENDWTAKYLSIIQGLKMLKVDSALLDGEVVWLDHEGRPDFQGLQNAMKAKRSGRLFYYAFDLLELNGEDLKSQPQRYRKQELERILPKKKAGVLRYSEHFEEEPTALFEKMCEMHLEGVISKNAEASYRSGRGRSWLKTKCGHAQEFVIGGFSKARGSRSHFGALYLGVYENKKMVYVGKVGTGFNEATLKELYGRLQRLTTAKSPFAKPPREHDATWVKPELVAEIRFAEWTKDGHLRVPVFHGLRTDKPAREIVREDPASVTAVETVSPEKSRPSRRKRTKRNSVNGKRDPVGIQISHPDKIYYQNEKLTKLDVANYYYSVAPLMLRYLSDRPISIIRCPEGSRKTCFLQKHLQGATDPSIQLFPMDEEDGEFFSVNSAKGLLALVQRGSLEIHVVNAKRPNLEFADQVVLDLDPDPSLSWKDVRAGAQVLKKILDDLNLTSFIKLTGGKGIHVHVPLEPKYDWDEVKAFAYSVATKMTMDDPKKFIDKSSKQARRGRIFVDYLRNSRMATAVCAYSLRAREYSSVAMPISWSELEKIESADQFTMKEGLKKIVERKKDPWAGYLETSNSLDRLFG